MKRFTCLFLLSFTIGKLAVQAQHDVTWYEGSLVLHTQQVRVGAIAIEAGHDLILFRAHDTVSVYPAHKIRYMQFYNPQSNMNQKYISVQEKDIAWRRYRLYELVVYGEVSVLRKEKANVFSRASDVDDYLYYILYNEKLTDLRDFHTKVYPDLMQNGGVLLSMFVLEKDLHPDKSAEAIRIIQYYNQLMRNDETLALRR
ncbi:MAG TPA: hypothetical protein VIN08_13425 [Ohtaekwangia sp.]|uniref:hypothetical protein n=1 Tax=Ohtaekwangia sp. TaxID=2066019 RepID=UPI002F9313D3